MPLILLPAGQTPTSDSHLGLTRCCGIKVPLTTREATTLALRQALETMAANPAETARMGQAARQRVTNLFTWPRRAEQIATIYDWVLGRRPTRPEPIKHS